MIRKFRTSRSAIIIQLCTETMGAILYLLQFQQFCTSSEVEVLARTEWQINYEFITGVIHDQLVGRSLREFVDTGFDLSSAWKSFLEKGRFRGEVMIRHSSGSLRDLEASGVVHIGPGRHLFVGRDITDRKRMERELRQERLHP